MAAADLFTSADVPAPAKVPEMGLFATNHLNLMYMLAVGLVMPPAGFGDKYYRDTLASFPGWIPLFLDKVPKEAIESSIQEAGHLKPTIVRVGLSGISGNLIALGEHGQRELHFPEQLDGTERVLLVPAPLPTSRFESIVFQSADDKRVCERDAKEFDNVPMEDFKRGLGKTLFSKAPNTHWPPGEGPVERTVPLELPLATGGVMAMLLLFGNLGAQAVRACRNAFDPAGDPSPPSDHHLVLSGLGAWVDGGVAPHSVTADPEMDRAALQSAFQARLFWEVVVRLVQWRESDRAGSAENVLLDYLAEASASLDPRLQAGVGKLRNTLESLTGLADATASELFERHDTPLGRAMALFFLRRDCVDLFDFHSDQLGELDWLAAAILFGVREGWLSLPLRLRAGRDLSDAVSHRMARLSHRIAGTGLDLGEAPARARPLRERFGDGTAWRPGEKSAALELARIQKWDCVFTRISLGAGEYTLTVKGGSIHIELPGEPRISPEIDLDRFFDFLASARFDSKTEAKVRARFRG